MLVGRPSGVVLACSSCAVFLPHGPVPHGSAPWPCAFVAQPQGSVSWLCSVVLLHGFVLWLCSMALHRGPTLWPCAVLCAPGSGRGQGSGSLRCRCAVAPLCLLGSLAHAPLRRKAGFGVGTAMWVSRSALRVSYTGLVPALLGHGVAAVGGLLCAPHPRSLCTASRRALVSGMTLSETRQGQPALPRPPRAPVRMIRTKEALRSGKEPHLCGSEFWASWTRFEIIRCVSHASIMSSAPQMLNTDLP